MLYQNVDTSPSIGLFDAFCSDPAASLHSGIAPCSQCDDLHLHLPFLEKSNTLISVARWMDTLALMTLMMRKSPKSKVNPLLVEFHLKGINMTHAAGFHADVFLPTLTFCGVLDSSVSSN